MALVRPAGQAAFPRSWEGCSPRIAQSFALKKFVSFSTATVKSKTDGRNAAHLELAQADLCLELLVVTLADADAISARSGQALHESSAAIRTLNALDREEPRMIMITEAQSVALACIFTRFSPFLPSFATCSGANRRERCSLRRRRIAVFLPNECLQVLEALRSNWGAQAWGRYGFVDAFNSNSSPKWYNSDCLGIDLGISVLMAENLRSGLVWQTFMSNPEPVNAMQLVGFH